MIKKLKEELEKQRKRQKNRPRKPKIKKEKKPREKMFVDPEKVKKFRAVLEKFAEKNKLKITEIKSWTEPKIDQMAMDPEHRCCCDPKNRTCPCDKCVHEIEISVRNMCHCSVFTRDFNV